VRFLICGLGSMGRRHLRNLVQLGERDIVLFRTGHSTLPDDELSGFPVETDLAAALSRNPDAVVVANPTALHLDVAIPAAQAGCHLLIEKPVSHNLDRLDELEAAVARGGGRVLVGFQFRFNSGLRKAKRWLEENAIGRPLSVRAHWGEYLPGWHPWEDFHQSYSARPDLGGGVVLTLCHPFDYLRWLLGEVSALWAMTGTLGNLGLEVEDTAEVGLHFAAGCQGSVHLDYLQRPPEHHLEVVGEEGTIRWNDGDGAVQVFRSSGQAWEAFPAPAGFERNTMFLEEMGHFLAVMRGEEDPLCPLADGVWALRLALGALTSAREGRLVSFSEERDQ
jgi:predicted dehydrogenase